VNCAMGLSEFKLSVAQMNGSIQHIFNGKS